MLSVALNWCSVLTKASKRVSRRSSWNSGEEVAEIPQARQDPRFYSELAYPIGTIAVLSGDSRPLSTALKWNSVCDELVEAERRCTGVKRPQNSPSSSTTLYHSIRYRRPRLSWFDAKVAYVVMTISGTVRASRVCGRFGPWNRICRRVFIEKFLERHQYHFESTCLMLAKCKSTYVEISDSQFSISSETHRQQSLACSSLVISKDSDLRTDGTITKVALVSNVCVSDTGNECPK